MSKSHLGLSLSGRNQSLCWVKTQYNERQVPTTEGYYFNDYPSGSGKVYYGKTLSGTAQEVADFGDVDIEKNVVAVSPAHGSILTGPFDVVPGTGLQVYEDSKYSTLNIEDKPIQAWLYNSGIDFFTDENGDEFCLFGEFSHLPAQHRRLFKGRYPYADINNWKVVGAISGTNTDGILTSYYQIKRDPWSKYIYCTTGPNPDDAKIFYSTDNGETWTLLIENPPAGCLKMINFIFLEDYIWWASDEIPHFLMRAKRNTIGLLDISTVQIFDHLPLLQATNATAYIKELHSLFFYDRIYDNSGLKLHMCIFDLKKKKLKRIGNLTHKNNIDAPWGFRGKCYVFYPSLDEGLMAMGNIGKCIYCKLGNPFIGIGEDTGSTLLSVEIQACRDNYYSLSDSLQRIKQNIRTRAFDFYIPRLRLGANPQLHYGICSHIIQLVINWGLHTKSIILNIKNKIK